MFRSAPLKNPQQESQHFTRRIMLLLGIIALCFCALLSRLLILQIIDHQHYTTLSQKNRITLEAQVPKRGLITDRHGVLLAENIPVFSLEIIPNLVPDLDQTLKRLAQIIPIKDEDIQLFNRQKRITRHYHAVPLKMKLTPAQVATFAVHQFAYPGVQIHARLVRHYPLGALTAHVVGTVGRINPQESAQLDKSQYRDTRYIGKNGIEAFYEKALHGKTGWRHVEVDANGRPIRRLRHTPPIAGQALTLTLDTHLQRVGYAAFGDQTGALVAIDPRNGEVLALISNPSFDPNQFVKGLTSAHYQIFRQKSTHPLFNRVLHGQYPLASTVKPFLALAGLHEEVINANSYIRDPGHYHLKHSHHIFHDWLPTGHGIVNITRAITVSCDTFFYHLAHKLGIARINAVLQRFGFGHPTHIDLPHEASGLLPTPQWKRNHLKQAWYPGDTINAGIGQGYMLTTPLQLAQAVATLAERGIHHTPHLLKSSNAPAQMVYQADDHDWAIVDKAMQLVIESRHGTGHRFGHPVGYHAAGKTGTAQVFSKEHLHISSIHLPKRLQDHSWFMAFAPVDHPRIAIAVIAEHNATLAPIVARKVIDAYLLGQTKRKKATT